MAFDNKKTNNTNIAIRKTLPMPVTCECCGYELPNDAEKNSGYFVNFMVCRDMNRDNKIIVSNPRQFLKTEKVHNSEITAGSSSDGYHLKENYTFVKWIVWCVRCHSNKSKLQDMSRKTNNMIPTGNKQSLSLTESLKKLHSNQSMKSQSRPSS